VRNGAPCYSADASDPITAIWTSISGKIEKPVGAKLSPAAKKAEKPKAAGKKPPEEPAPGAKSKKSKIGPRFSVFREPATTEQE
jgi:hypothetical protein